MPTPQRYAAFLRGVMPTNAKMPELRKAFEAAGFTNVKTVLGSGNVVFDAKPQAAEALEKKAVAAMEKALGHSFGTLVRSVDELRALVEADPWSAWRVPAGAKRVVTFLRAAPGKVALPPEIDGSRIYGVIGREAFAAYLPTPKGPVFMSLLEKTFGKDVTTRTWDTVGKVTRA